MPDDAYIGNVSIRYTPLQGVYRVTPPVQSRRVLLWSSVIQPSRNVPFACGPQVLIETGHFSTATQGEKI